jgi:uncharacterized protein YdhG (YjbR/CyaY superfamily)
MRFPAEVQRRLQVIRAIGFEVFENATETVYHAVPTFDVDTIGILNYGAYKNHISMHLGYDFTDFFRNVYPQFNYIKTTIQFPHTDEFPDTIIREICEFLMDNRRGNG